MGITLMGYGSFQVDIYFHILTVLMVLYLSGLFSSVGRATLRGPGFKSQPCRLGGLVTIITWGTRPSGKLALI